MELARKITSFQDDSITRPTSGFFNEICDTLNNPNWTLEIKILLATRLNLTFHRNHKLESFLKNSNERFLVS